MSSVIIDVQEVRGSDDVIAPKVHHQARGVRGGGGNNDNNDNNNNNKSGLIPVADVGQGFSLRCALLRCWPSGIPRDCDCNHNCGCNHSKGPMDATGIRITTYSKVTGGYFAFPVLGQGSRAQSCTVGDAKSDVIANYWISRAIRLRCQARYRCGP